MKESEMVDYFPNYAGKENIDNKLEEELKLAGIKVEHLPEICRESRGEVESIVVGTLHGWSFKRAWRYWICKGPGIPVDVAMDLHLAFGKEVRVDGDCGCPSPLERFKGFGTGFYHVDTLRGLKALTGTIQGVVEKTRSERENYHINSATCKVSDSFQ